MTNAWDDAIEGFLYWMRVEKHASQHTIDAYGRDLRSFAEWSARNGAGDPADVGGTHISDYMVSLQDPDYRQPPS